MMKMPTYRQVLGRWNALRSRSASTGWLPRGSNDPLENKVLPRNEGEYHELFAHKNFQTIEVEMRNEINIMASRLGRCKDGHGS